MGYDVYSGVVVGYLLKKEQVEITSKKRTCNHNTDTTKKFCSECGKPVWKEYVEKKISEEDNYDNFIPVKYNSGDSPLYAVGITSGLKNANYNGSNNTINFNSLPTDLSQYAVELKNTLATLGVTVDIKDFGVHAVVYHSY